MRPDIDAGPIGRKCSVSNNPPADAVEEAGACGKEAGRATGAPNVAKQRGGERENAGVPHEQAPGATLKGRPTENIGMAGRL